MHAYVNLIVVGCGKVQAKSPHVEHSFDISQIGAYANVALTGNGT